MNNRQQHNNKDNKVYSIIFEYKNSAIDNLSNVSIRNNN